MSRDVRVVEPGEYTSPAVPPEIDGIPCADGRTLPSGPLPGRPYALPADLLVEELGPLFYADFGVSRRLYACSLDLVEELCDETRFIKGITDRLDRFRPLAGDGLFTAYPGEPNWQKAHDVLLPGFSYSGLRNYHPAMLDINRQLLARWDASTDGPLVDVAEDLAKLAMDTVGLAGFGTRFDSYQREGLAPVPLSFALALQQMLAPGGGDQDLFTAEQQKLHTFIDALIAQHGDDAAEHENLLGLMLASGSGAGPALELSSIHAQVLTFLIAGQDTTSTVMPTALYSLVKNPAVLHRAQAEVDALFGPEDEHTPTFDEIGKLRYIRQIVDETLRLSPPVREFDRMATEDTVLAGRYPVRQGEVVTVLTTSLHRQPQWGDNVETFDPDRFSPESSAGRPANLFKPFGTGARSCIGRQFALHEATMAIATLVHRYRFIDSEHYQLRTHSDLLRKPVGFRVGLVRRTSQDRRHKPVAAATAGPHETRQPTATAAPGSALIVFHGSNLGTCRALAHQLAEEATDLGYRTTVAPLDDAAEALPTEGAMVVVAASYNGQPTDDARQFLTWLDSAKPHPDSGLRYAVLGVGDRNWAETYQAIPRRIDEGLAAYGATPILPRGEADTSGDFAGTVEAFSQALWTSLGGVAGSDASTVPLEAPLYELRAIDGPVTAAIDARFEVVPMTILDNRELVSADNSLGQAKRLVRIELPADIDYRTGDHLTVLADNQPELVDKAAELLGLILDRRISVNARRSTRRAIALDREVSVRELLTHFLELRKPATRTQLLRLAAANPCPPERAALEALADHPEARSLGIAGCLLEFPATKLSRAELLELFEPMSPRHYSIASSNRQSPRVVELVVSVLDAPARSGFGDFQGVASNYLANVTPGQQIRARVDQARQAFRAGADPSRNVILVSAGTGVAPFRGFVGDRLAALDAGEPFAPALCFFGIRHPEVDYLFREEFEAAERSGVVQMRPAFSRASENGVKYVQDRIAADADDIWDLLGDPAKQTHVYVCGDGGKMAPAVRDAFLHIYREHTGADEPQARDWLIELVEADRYVEDVWTE